MRTGREGKVGGGEKKINEKEQKEGVRGEGKGSERGERRQMEGGKEEVKATCVSPPPQGMQAPLQSMMEDP